MLSFKNADNYCFPWLTKFGLKNSGENQVLRTEELHKTNFLQLIEKLTLLEMMKIFRKWLLGRINSKRMKNNFILLVFN